MTVSPSLSTLLGRSGTPRCRVCGSATCHLVGGGYDPIINPAPPELPVDERAPLPDEEKAE